MSFTPNTEGQPVQEAPQAHQANIPLAGQTPAVKPLRRAVSKPVMPSVAAPASRFKNN